MGNMQKLPFVLGSVAAIIIGFAGYLGGTELKDTYLEMLIGMLVFFIIGLSLRKTLLKIQQELDDKREQEELEKEAEIEAARKLEEEESQQVQSGQNIDYKVDDSLGEDFSPLNVSKIISTKD